MRCGSGCSEWIAAEGYFDPDADRHFREFLERARAPQFAGVLQFAWWRRETGGRDRPYAAAISNDGRCRAHDSGRLSPDGCDGGRLPSRRCVEARTPGEVRGRRGTLRIRLRLCAHRRLGPTGAAGRRTRYSFGPVYLGCERSGAELATEYRARARGPAKLCDRVGGGPRPDRRRRQIDPDRIHAMTRAEIERFGIETRGFYETPWARLEETLLTFSVTKAWRQAEAGSNDYRTRVIRLRCSNSIRIFAELSHRTVLVRLQHAPAVRLAPGGDELLLARMFSQAGSTVGVTVVPREVMQRIAGRAQA